MHPLASEKIWFEKSKVEEAESNYYSKKHSGAAATASSGSALVADIQNIKDHIRSVLGGESTSSGVSEIDMQRLETLEKENKALKSLISSLEGRVAALELGSGAPAAAKKPVAEPAAAASDDDDDDVDLFGSDDEEEDEAAAKLRDERLAAYAAKKSKKPALIAKSMIILDVKPWDDETDLKAMEDSVKSVALDGLVWGTSKLVPVGYGIKKLQITCVVEDLKVGTDDLEDAITAFEDYVQSVDVVAFNKL